MPHRRNDSNRSQEKLWLVHEYEHPTERYSQPNHSHSKNRADVLREIVILEEFVLHEKNHLQGKRTTGQDITRWSFSS